MGKEIRYNVRLENLTIKSEHWIQTLRPAVRQVLIDGGLAVLPTETSYMLGGDASRLATMQRLRRLKGRAWNHNISVMFSSVEKARRWTHWNEMAEMLAERYLPGPLTLILRLKDGVCQGASAGHTLGVRVPGQPFLLDLLSEIDFPVSATSANPHGAAEPYKIDQCVSPVDIVWNAGRLYPEPPSTIVDLTTEQPAVVRQGCLMIDLGAKKHGG